MCKEHEEACGDEYQCCIHEGADAGVCCFCGDVYMLEPALHTRDGGGCDRDDHGPNRPRRGNVLPKHVRRLLRDIIVLDSDADDAPSLEGMARRARWALGLPANRRPDR